MQHVFQDNIPQQDVLVPQVMENHCGEEDLNVELMGQVDRLKMQLYLTSAFTRVMLMKVVSSQQLRSVHQERIHDRHDQDALDVHECQLAQ